VSLISTPISELFGKAMHGLMYVAAAGLLLDERIDALKRTNAAVALATESFQADAARGQKAVSTMQARLAQLEADNDSLTRSLAHVPRVASTAACPQPGAARLTRGGVLRLNTALGHPELPASAAAVPGAAAGADPAGISEPAEPSGISVDDAQSNAEINYGRCAAIRTRCLALIDFLKARPTDGPITAGELNER